VLSRFSESIICLPIGLLQMSGGETNEQVDWIAVFCGLRSDQFLERPRIQIRGEIESQKMAVRIEMIGGLPRNGPV